MNFWRSLPEIRWQACLSPGVSADRDAGWVRTGRGWGGNRLGAVIALHLVKFAHELGALGERLAHHQAFADEACPKEGD
jgi:hypothetical protein